MFGGNYAPAGWMFCDGSIISIADYETLYNLIGTTYGGDGQYSFGLPDLRGRLPVHFGNGMVLAQQGGSETVTLSTSQLPSHTHPMLANNSVANSPNPGNDVIGLASQVNLFFGDQPNVPMAPGAITQTGGSQSHDNMMPYLCVSFIISLYGIFPTPT